MAPRAEPGHILPDPAPFILQTSLDDFYVSYELNAVTDRADIKAMTYSRLHQNIQEAFNESGVEIMSPHYATLRDGNQSTIPSGHLPATNAAPPFRPQTVGAEAITAADGAGAARTNGRAVLRNADEAADRDAAG